MSIRPVKFYDDGTMDVVHDDGGFGCTGRIAISDTVLEDDLRHIVIVCPGGCGSASRHGASAAVDPDMVQRLFVRRIAQKRKVNFRAARAVHRQLLEDMGLGERWKLQDVLDVDEGPRARPPTPMREMLRSDAEAASE